MTFHIMLRHTGLAEWQWDAGRAAGLIGSPDVDGRRWSAAIANDVIARRDEITAVVGTEAPIGGHKAAARLAERSGLAVESRMWRPWPTPACSRQWGSRHHPAQKQRLGSRSGNGSVRYGLPRSP
jgi:hypothetical protein